ncbi:Uncharacterised protein [Burkholderia pseudomallei]|nr:Uncharacterised protein [Burkholderia pseudomallei]
MRQLNETVAENRPSAGVFAAKPIILRANPGPDAGFAPDAGRPRFHRGAGRTRRSRRSKTASRVPERRRRTAGFVARPRTRLPSWTAARERPDVMYSAAAMIARDCDRSGTAPGAGAAPCGKASQRKYSVSVVKTQPKQRTRRPGAPTVRHPASPRAVPPRLAPPCLALPCLALPRHATPRHAMPCHAMPCHAMPCRAMPRHVVVRRAACAPAPVLASVPAPGPRSAGPPRRSADAIHCASRSRCPCASR